MAVGAKLKVKKSIKVQTKSTKHQNNFKCFSVLSKALRQSVAKRHRVPSNEGRKTFHVAEMQARKKEMCIRT